MKAEPSPKLSLKEAFKLSGRYTRKRAPKLWLITYLLIRNRKYVYLCFSYLKWVDDFVDNPNNDKQKKLKFIENQLNLLSSLYKGEETVLNCNEEFYLYYCIHYARSINKFNIIKEGKESIESIEMDAGRLFNKGLFSAGELDNYGIKTVRPVFNLSYYALIPSIELPLNNKYAGKFIWVVLNLRDFSEDIDSGYINISREELIKYEIDIDNLRKNQNLCIWLKDKYEEYIDLLNEDITILKSMPLKVKLFWSPIYPFMIYELIKIKVYEYNLIRLKKRILKEFKILTQTCYLSIKFFARIFL